MTTVTARTARTWWHWLVLFLSFPLSGLVSTLLFGPVESWPVALGAGAVVGLVIGATSALALGTPSRRWVPATVIGLALGTLASLLLPVIGPLVQGAVLALARSTARPPLRPLLWVPVATAAWGTAWVISWIVAISDEPGFVTFGASGALFYTLVMLLVKRVAR